MAGPDCPVCGGASSRIAQLPREEVVQVIEQSLAARGLRDIPWGDFTLWRCASCGLEFADPMREPGSEFYQWLTRSGFRYPASRWEWEACSQMLGRLRSLSGDANWTIVDVGCGDGGFLSLLSGLKGGRCIGLDLNPDVVALCRSKGLEVIHGDFAAAHAQLPQGVDAVSLWHVVEHVGDPVRVLEQTKALLREGGMICFSVPLTPMSYEHSWWDPFNAPPHHLTRWCVPALHALANRLGMRMELILPDADPYHHRVLRSLALQAQPTFGNTSRWYKALRLARLLVRRPWRLVLEGWRQAKHPRINGKVQPDVVLVCLRHA